MSYVFVLAFAFILLKDHQDKLEKDRVYHHILLFNKFVQIFSIQSWCLFSASQFKQHVGNAVIIELSNKKKKNTEQCYSSLDEVNLNICPEFNFLILRFST